MRYRAAVLFLIAFSMFFNFSCKEIENMSDNEFVVTVKNMTGVEISELYFAPESNDEKATNLLTENLPINGQIELSLGLLSDADIADGFALQVYNAEDGSFETFSELQVKNGSTVSFYIDVWGLAVAVDMTDKEIDELKQQDYEDAVSATYITEQTAE